MPTLAHTTAAEKALADYLRAVLIAPDILRKAQYITALRKHDWSHEFSDDARKVREGQAVLAQLRQEADEIDADRAIWNANVPSDEYRVTARVYVCQYVMHDGTTGTVEVTSASDWGAINAAQLKLSAPAMKISARVKE